MNMLAVANALKAVAASVTGVATAAIGINQAWPSTPAVEVIPARQELTTLAAGATTQLVDGVVFLAAYVALTRNLEEDEQALLPIVQELLEALAAPAFDRTLGGLVEDTRAVRVEFDLVKREGRPYRAAVITVVVGDVTDPV